MGILVAPLLRWAGSKRAIVRDLSRYWSSPTDKYIEPFCGSAALFFHIQPALACFGDLNFSLINFYRQAQSNPVAIWKTVSSWPRTSEFYYRVRQEFNSVSTSEESAARFLYLNRNCFNGIFRTNRSGNFNVPFSGKRMPAMPSLEDFCKSSELLSRAIVLHADFEETITSNLGSGNFFFIDPPYATAKRRVFAEYGPKVFGPWDLERLINLLDDIDESGGKFVCTYDACDAQLFEGRGWNVKFHGVHRNVGGFSSSRRIAKEVLISNVKVE